MRAATTPLDVKRDDAVGRTGQNKEGSYYSVHPNISVEEA